MSNFNDGFALTCICVPVDLGRCSRHSLALSAPSEDSHLWLCQQGTIPLLVAACTPFEALQSVGSYAGHEGVFAQSLTLFLRITELALNMHYRQYAPDTLQRTGWSSGSV